MSETKTPTQRDLIQSEALSKIVNKTRAGLDISMGVGKTYIGLQYLQKVTGLFEKILVAAPKRSIFESWKNDAIKFDMEPILEKITFTTYISLNKHNPADYTVLVLDEAHNAKDSHRPFLENFKGRILGLTGTPPKWGSSEQGMIMHEFYPIAYSYTVDNAVSSGILNDYAIFIHPVPLSDAKDIKTKQGWYSSEYQQYNYLTRRVDEAVGQSSFKMNILRLSAMKQFKSKETYVQKCLKLIKPEDKCLIFSNTTEQADRICEHSYHSKNSKEVNNNNLEAFKNGTITRLSAVEQLSEGITVPNLKHIIIMHAYGNEKKASQKIGRALRLNPNEKSSIHILAYQNTVDQKWVNQSLESFDKTKIKTANIR